MALAAIETVYRGHRMRSRLEARWAAFFDALGWSWEYEPFDANGYIPDFAVMGPWAIAVEVKPVMSVRELQAYEARVVDGLSGGWQDDILIVGATPEPFSHGDVSWHERGHPVAGWLLERLQAPRDIEWAGAEAVWCRCEEANELGIVHTEQSFAARPCGHYDGGCWQRPVGGEVQELWGAAASQVRWRASRTTNQ